MDELRPALLSLPIKDSSYYETLLSMPRIIPLLPQKVILNDISLHLFNREWMQQPLYIRFRQSRI